MLSDLLSLHGKMKSIFSSLQNHVIFVNNNFKGNILVLCHYSCYGDFIFLVVLVSVVLKNQLLIYVLHHGLCVGVTLDYLRTKLCVYFLAGFFSIWSPWE